MTNEEVFRRVEVPNALRKGKQYRIYKRINKLYPYSVIRGFQKYAREEATGTEEDPIYNMSNKHNKGVGCGICADIRGRADSRANWRNDAGHSTY